MKILVVGGGIAGLCTALELSLQGVEVTLLEKNKLGSGTTTRCAGMLHSGARYLAEDIEIAKFCAQENTIFQHTFPFAIDLKHAGLYVVFKERDNQYVESFEQRRSGFSIERISSSDCYVLEPKLNPTEIEYGYLTKDLVMNPFTIVQAYREELDKRGVYIKENSEIKKAEYRNGKWSIECLDESESFDGVINACGAGVSELIVLFGGSRLEFDYIHGSMAVLGDLFSNRVVSVCDKTAPGDVVLPSGLRSLVGSTWRILNYCNPTTLSEGEKEEMTMMASKLFPAIHPERVVSSFTGIRTYPRRSKNALDRDKFSKGFSIINHTDLPNVITVLAGKLSFGRLAAENAVRILFEKNGISFKGSKTRDYVLEAPQKEVYEILE